MRKSRPRRARKRPGRKRLLLVLVLAVVSACSVYAFTAAIGFSGASVQAGAGVTTPTTPSVSSMYFTYDSNTPLNISSLTLNFSASVTAVQASLAGSWSSSCTGSGSGPWTCTWSTEPTVSGISANKTLKVVAT